MRISFATAAAAVLSLTLAPLALAQEPVTPSAVPDSFHSANVEYLGSIKPDVGLTTGTKIIGNRMFVTSGKNISIYDISNPASPVRIGFVPNVSWENEEVPTNGKILAVASDFYSLMPNCVNNPDEGLGSGKVTGCIQYFDVRDPAHIREIGATPTQNHTAECVLDCTWFYGRAGTIVDARHALDSGSSFQAPRQVGNWITSLRTEDYPGEPTVRETNCHHIREIRPGVLLTACQPFAVISVNAEDGGSPLQPALLATGEAAKFVHSARWPRKGDDDLVLTGGEENFNPQCNAYPSKDNRVIGNNSEFSTYSAKAVKAGTSTQFEGPLDQVVPAGNGTYTDGKPPANHLGCSVHWFQEHPTFKNGGLVALSEYEDGVRFLQIHKDGSIEEQGYFVTLGSSSSSPKWAGKDDVLYSIDYDRGIDILKWKGEHYVPKPGKGKGVKPERGKVAGTEGTTPVPALNARQRRKLSSLGTRLRAGGWTPGLCLLASRL